GAKFAHLRLHLVGLAGADVKPGVGRIHARMQRAQDLRARGFHEFREFLCSPHSRTVAGVGQHQQRTFASFLAFEQKNQSCAGGSASSGGASSAPTLTGRLGTTVEMACLYTIWLTWLRNSTTNWSNDSTTPCSLMPLTR